MKLISTKPAKQFSGYALLKYDMEFAARAFGLAAQQATRTPAEIHAARPPAEQQVRELWAFEPVLRAGGAIARMDADDRTPNEVVRAALFEAAVITYGRCFTSGERTQLKEEIFRGPLATARQTHEAIMKVRHKHIAHSELKMERSIVGFDLVEDPTYGKRPSMSTGVIVMRRDVPSNERLLELRAHCEEILVHAILPKFLKSGDALREQLLAMPSEQLERLPDFASAPTDLDELL